MPHGDAREGARAAVHTRLRASARHDPVATLAWIDTFDLSTSRDAERAAGVVEALSPTLTVMSRAAEPCLRLVAVDLLGHFAGSADARTAMESLLKDTDWRVRQEAETVLEHEGVLPGGYSVPLTDLLARWLRRFFWLCKTVNGLGRLVIRAPDFDRMRGTSPQWSQFPAPGAAVPSRFRPSFPYSTNK